LLAKTIFARHDNGVDALPVRETLSKLSTFATDGVRSSSALLFNQQGLLMRHSRQGLPGGKNRPEKRRVVRNSRDDLRSS
jgi:hypothetical protein